MIALSEIFGSLDYLVRLASLGAAGVSILAIFMIGRELFDLPNNTSNTKATLIKKYMRMCTIIAIICAISGVANAYFNKEKIEKAEGNFEELTNIYTEQIQRFNKEKSAIYTTLDSLQTHIRTSNELMSPSINTLFERTKSQLDQLQLTPQDTIINAVRINSIDNFPESINN